MGTLGPLASVVERVVVVLGPLLAPVWAVWPGGPRRPIPLDGASVWDGVVLVPVSGPASVHRGGICCMPVPAPPVAGGYHETGLRVLVGWWCEV